MFADEQFDGFFVHAAKHKITTSASMKVNKTKRRIQPKTTSGWVEAVLLTVRYFSAPTRADTLLMPLRKTLGSREYAVCQDLFYGVLRNFLLLQRSVDCLCARPPVPEARALLMVAGYELMESGDSVEQRALVTHHAVEMSAEILPEKFRGFVNAVLRRIPEVIKSIPGKSEDPIERLYVEYSHPRWLVKRWIEAFGEENARKLLAWDQSIPSVYIRMENGVTAPDSLKPSQWKGFYEYQGHGWDEVEKLLKDRKAYAQDPSTRISVELLAPKPGESVIDLCAAPGGKAREILSVMDGKGILACVDLPGARSERLVENLAGDHGELKLAVIGKDVFELDDATFVTNELPTKFAAVLLDAPCSNTGVLRRRPDARWRLSREEIAQAADLQKRLLQKASTLVADNGRLVYSTCSIDASENEELVAAFLASNPQFTLTEKRLAYPWVDGHDGAGAFLLTRKSN
jgi:16S rRNA (cytosine967-C5)-methyltransferase